MLISADGQVVAKCDVGESRSWLERQFLMKSRSAAGIFVHHARRTLRRFIEAAGGELCITARFPDGDPVEIEGFGDIEPSAQPPRKARKNVRSATNAKNRRKKTAA